MCGVFFFFMRVFRSWNILLIYCLVHLADVVHPLVLSWLRRWCKSKFMSRRFSCLGHFQSQQRVCRCRRHFPRSCYQQSGWIWGSHRPHDQCICFGSPLIGNTTRLRTRHLTIDIALHCLPSGIISEILEGTLPGMFIWCYFLMNIFLERQIR